MIKQFLKLIVYLIPGILCCSLNVADTGGGTEVGNGIISGTVFNDNGTPGVGVQVRLIPAGHNPLSSNPIPDYHCDTTDESGTYRITVFDSITQVFTIEAVHLTNSKTALITNIEVPDEADFIKYVPQAMVKEPGILKLFLPDTIDTADGCIYIEGTTLLKDLSDATPVNEGGYSIILNAIPESVIPAIHYGKMSTSFKPEVLSDTIVVISNDTSVADAFVFWAYYTKENSSLPKAIPFDVLAAPDGKIWVATDVEGVLVYDGASWTAYNAANSDLPDNTVYHISMDNSDNLWFSTYSGAVKFDGTAWFIFSTGTSDIPTNLINQIEEDRTGVLWLATMEGVAQYDGSVWHTFNSNNSELPSDEVRSLAFDSDGSIWFATSKGIANFSGTSWVIYTTQNSGMLSDDTYLITVDSGGNKWIGYFWDVGVTRYDGTGWITYNSEHSRLLDGIVEQVTQDTHGDIWIVTNCGLTRFDGERWLDFVGKRFALLEKKAITAIDIDREDNKWLGTWYGDIKNGVIAFGPTIK